MKTVKLERILKRDFGYVGIDKLKNAMNGGPKDFARKQEHRLVDLAYVPGIEGAIRLQSGLYVIGEGLHQNLPGKILTERDVQVFQMSTDLNIQVYKDVLEELKDWGMRKKLIGKSRIEHVIALAKTPSKTNVLPDSYHIMQAMDSYCKEHMSPHGIKYTGNGKKMFKSSYGSRILTADDRAGIQALVK